MILELDNTYIIDKIENEEGIDTLGTQQIECIAKSTTAWLIIFTETNSRLWLPFERKINILEQL